LLPGNCRAAFPAEQLDNHRNGGPAPVAVQKHSVCALAVNDNFLAGRPKVAEKRPIRGTLGQSNSAFGHKMLLYGSDCPGAIGQYGSHSATADRGQLHNPKGLLRSLIHQSIPTGDFLRASHNWHIDAIRHGSIK